MDCPHEVVDYDVLLLVPDGHGHVTHGAARLVHGVLGARWHGQTVAVFSMVFTESLVIFADCWQRCSLCVFRSCQKIDDRTFLFTLEFEIHLPGQLSLWIVRLFLRRIVTKAYLV